MLFKSWTGRSDHAKHFAVLQWRSVLVSSFGSFQQKRPKAHKQSPCKARDKEIIRKLEMALQLYGEQVGGFTLLTHGVSMNIPYKKLGHLCLTCNNDVCVSVYIYIV